MNLSEHFTKSTCPEFREDIARIATAAKMPVLAVYQLWLDYDKTCRDCDQSAILFEFIRWYRKQLNLTEDQIQALSF